MFLLLTRNRKQYSYKLNDKTKQQKKTFEKTNQKLMKQKIFTHYLSASHEWVRYRERERADKVPGSFLQNDHDHSSE